WTVLGRVSGGGDDPGSITDPAVLANAFFMARGYTLVWSGWEALGTLDTFNASANLPIAKFPPTAANPTGTITGPSYEYIVVGAAAASVALSYPAATLDKTRATLTHRVHLDDAPQVVSASGWNYNADGTAISLVGSSFIANDIYEFAYTAKDPKVLGLGFAAVRDWMEFLRYERRDEKDNPNPLAGHIKRVYTEISSQPGRFLNDFRHLGFNETENGKKAFDGHMQWIAAGNGLNMNYRFSQTGRTERNRQNHLFIEGRFPFANVRTFDPITRQTDSRYASCEKTDTCPLGVEIYSANEYWVKSYETRIATVNPPLFPFTTPSYQDNPGNGPIYPSFIPKTDSDGNDIAGVRLPDVTVPLATYTGWALRRGAQASDGCEASGQFIPFAKTESDRTKTNDPRPSVEARYNKFADYHDKVRSALEQMVADRLLLCEDAATEEARLMQVGLTRGVPPPQSGVLPAIQVLAACEPKKHHGRKDRDDDD